jgi:hypothetical protein
VIRTINWFDPVLFFVSVPINALDIHWLLLLSVHCLGVSGFVGGVIVVGNIIDHNSCIILLQLVVKCRIQTLPEHMSPTPVFSGFVLLVI